MFFLSLSLSLSISLPLSLSLSLYIYIYIYEVDAKSCQTFSYVQTWNSSSLRSNLVRLNALVLPFQGLLEGWMEVLLRERANDLRQSLFHLHNCLITTASELRKLPKVIGSKVWTIGTVRNCLDVHLCQIVCDNDRVVDWCIVLVEMQLTRF